MFGFVGLLCAAQLRLGAPFADGAVLQRGMKVPVWGTATAGASISVSFAGQFVSTTAETNGVWRVTLAPMPACKEGRAMRATAEYPVKANWNAGTDRRGPTSASFQQPTVLWNGMVAAFAPMALRGFFWYQGADRAEPQRYAAKMHALYNEASLPLGAFETK